MLKAQKFSFLSFVSLLCCHPFPIYHFYTLAQMSFDTKEQGQCFEKPENSFQECIWQVICMTGTTGILFNGRITFQQIWSICFNFEQLICNLVEVLRQQSENSLKDEKVCCFLFELDCKYKKGLLEDINPLFCCNADFIWLQIPFTSSSRLIFLPATLMLGTT